MGNDEIDGSLMYTICHELGHGVYDYAIRNQTFIRVNIIKGKNGYRGGCLSYPRVSNVQSYLAGDIMVSLILGRKVNEGGHDDMSRAQELAPLETIKAAEAEVYKALSPYKDEVERVALNIEKMFREKGLKSFTIPTESVVRICQNVKQ